MTMRHRILKSFALFLIANSIGIQGASAQNNPQNALKNGLQIACPPTTTIKAPQLYGIWQVTFINPPAGLPARAVLLLEKHEEFADSLSGLVSRDSVTASGHAAKAALAGDVEDGVVILDESSNNTSISGTWNGELVQSACGREVKGVWKDTSTSAAPDAPDVPFTMVKRPGW
jgi:hypothetical protein